MAVIKRKQHGKEVGDKAEFQNDIGVYTPIIYECGLASDGRTVLAVSATAGRLPP
ncbi:hypothetical protein OI25_6016 [Paraburkholderia fungorum]|jgi:hypothetical protein|uniref:Uncharacterized protein n=1 Tax=Paraburkholderia fungorum TaxID=134537 RepID=A0AAU8TCD9_9BURK|nr:hypothetical protein [Paraburkholderia fungorum]AJZ61402.1 hypothetical protein OI25_6016 [Paraburkholderia fungorum]